MEAEPLVPGEGTSPRPRRRGQYDLLFHAAEATERRGEHDLLDCPRCLWLDEVEAPARRFGQSDGDEFGSWSQSVPTPVNHALEENDMTATYTFDVFSSLDGFGA